MAFIKDQPTLVEPANKTRESTTYRSFGLGVLLLLCECSLLLNFSLITLLGQLVSFGEGGGGGGGEIRPLGGLPPSMNC